MLSAAAIKEFKKIYYEQFGEDISDEVALDLAVNFLTFMNAVYRPVKEIWAKEYEKNIV